VEVYGRGSGFQCPRRTLFVAAFQAHEIRRSLKQYYEERRQKTVSSASTCPARPLCSHSLTEMPRKRQQRRNFSARAGAAGVTILDAACTSRSHWAFDSNVPLLLVFFSRLPRGRAETASPPQAGYEPCRTALKWVFGVHFSLRQNGPRDCHPQPSAVCARHTTGIGPQTLAGGPRRYPSLVLPEFSWIPSIFREAEAVSVCPVR